MTGEPISFSDWFRLGYPNHVVEQRGLGTADACLFEFNQRPGHFLDPPTPDRVLVPMHRGVGARSISAQDGSRDRSNQAR